MDSNSKAIFICKFQTNDWVKGNKYLISHMSIKDCVVVNKFRNYNVRFFFGVRGEPQLFCIPNIPISV